MTAPRLTGGCLCGSVRYEVGDTEPEWAGYCHCSMCRRASGAPFLGWFTVPATALRITGPLRAYRSSTLATRGFCPDCGAQVTFQFESRSDSIDLTTATLDDMTLVQPSEHIYWADRIPGLDIADSLPKRPGR